MREHNVTLDDAPAVEALRAKFREGKVLSASPDFPYRDWRRQNFSEFLAKSRGRFGAIAVDEEEEESAGSGSSSAAACLRGLLDEYGEERAASLRCGSPSLEALKDFLLFFRYRFPYYRDGCSKCRNTARGWPRNDGPCACPCQCWRRPCGQSRSSRVGWSLKMRTSDERREVEESEASGGSAFPIN